MFDLEAIYNKIRENRNLTFFYFLLFIMDKKNKILIEKI